MKISIIGTGYVGLVSGACFAELGNQVICVDNDASKIKNLKKLIIPIYEPGLEQLVKKNVRNKRLSFNTSIRTAVQNSEVIFIAVSTPSRQDGEADLTAIENVASQIAQSMQEYRLIVEKSTVPVETGRHVINTIEINNRANVKFDVASNPEFLREGSAIYDFMKPDRIVIGVESKRAKEILTKLYKPLKAPIVVTDINSAELIKHASNSFLATKVSFINAISQVCEKAGADVEKVALGMGLDRRIQKTFLNAGLGYGGACLPKDLDAFIHIAEKLGYNFDLLKAVKKINQQQKALMLKKIRDAIWIIKDKTIGILGLTFKPNTDDIRNAVSLELIQELRKEGAKVKVYDPAGMKRTKRIIPQIKFCSGPYQVAKDCDCLLVVTEWDEFKNLDWKKVKKLLKVPLIIDGRNIFDPAEMKKLGLRYISIGRNSV